MTTKNTRTKTTATAWVPQSQAEVSGAVLEIGEHLVRGESAGIVCRPAGACRVADFLGVTP
ncbi:MAG: hypothetical protein LBQ81_08630 [Zoogloeaceae bacterium]|jgi:hypothetical protein|nr:hypothetical protein [Zoogloeaceae bacterium]